MMLFAGGGTIYNISQVSYRQAITPNRMLGRMNATMRFMVWGTMPLGSLTGRPARHRDRTATDVDDRGDRRRALGVVGARRARAHARRRA